MKIGDKVRFLSEVGGGIVKGFRGKDIVLVEDIPFLPDQYKSPVLFEFLSLSSGYLSLQSYIRTKIVKKAAMSGNIFLIL